MSNWIKIEENEYFDVDNGVILVFSESEKKGKIDVSYGFGNHEGRTFTYDPRDADKIRASLDQSITIEEFRAEQVGAHARSLRESSVILDTLRQIG